MSKSLFERFLAPFLILSLFILGISLTSKENPILDSSPIISFLDVGQGDSAFIKTKNENYILIDGGPDKKVLNELGESLPPFERKLKAIILTHPHADHVAGLNYVLDKYEVETVYLTGVIHTAPDYLVFLEKIKTKNIPAQKFYFGKEIELDGVLIRALWPSDDLSGQRAADLNATSIVTEISIEGNSILMLGDLPTKEQEEMLKKTSLKTSKIIKVSHHGSKSGTRKDLISLLNCDYAVISVGKDNDFGHPHRSVLNLFSNQRILRTDQMGRIIFSFNQNNITLH